MPKINYKLSDGTTAPSVTQIIGQTLGYGLDGLCYYNWSQGKNGIQWKYDMKRKGAIGTLVHELIDGKISPESIEQLKEDGDFGTAACMFLRYFAWPGSSMFGVKHHELSMVSEKLRIGGTTDMVCIDPDLRVGIIDYKTSKSVRESHLIQLAAYRAIYEELTGEQVEFAGVIHIAADKEPSLYLFEQPELDLGYQAFAACLELFRTKSPLGKALRAGMVKDIAA